jgi:hypothetical protein
MKAKYLILAGLALAAAGSLSAAPIVFNFNNISLSNSSETGLTGQANSAAILASMNGAPGCGGSCVKSVTGAIATSNYDPDGNAGYKSGQLLTLGTTDGATAYNDASSYNTKTKGPDEFIMNDDFGLYSSSQSINITFNAPLAVGTVVSYDWEIFADDTCASPSCTPLPDLEFEAGGVLEQTFVGSRIAGYDPQAMGTTSFTLTAATNLLQWFDWPPEIGIDNLTITPPLLKTVPEPSPLALMGLALALLALVRWTLRRGPAADLLT